jgi:hypothetical protein
MRTSNSVVIYQFIRGADGLPDIMRFVQKWRGPESVDSPRASSVFYAYDPLTRGVTNRQYTTPIDRCV